MNLRPSWSWKYYNFPWPCFLITCRGRSIVLPRIFPKGGDSHTGCHKWLRNYCCCITTILNRENFDKCRTFFFFFFRATNCQMALTQQLLDYSSGLSQYGNDLKVKVPVAQSYLTPCDPMGCSPRDSSVHGILQERILEWVAALFPRGSSRPSDWT